MGSAACDDGAGSICEYSGWSGSCGGSGSSGWVRARAAVGRRLPLTRRPLLRCRTRRLRRQADRRDLGRIAAGWPRCRGAVSRWPSLVAGCSDREHVGHRQFVTLVGQTLGNLAEVLVIATLLRRLLGRGRYGRPTRPPAAGAPRHSSGDGGQRRDRQPVGCSRGALSAGTQCQRPLGRGGSVTPAGPSCCCRSSWPGQRRRFRRGADPGRSRP